MSDFCFAKSTFFVFVLCAATVIACPAKTVKTLASFDGSDGASPEGSLIKATDGNFYGTTKSGGANGFGSVFKMTPDGALTTLYSFCAKPNCVDGNGPIAGLLQASDGNFYGTTYYGGSNCVFSVLSLSGCGTIFRITAAGQLTTIYNFCETGDGSTCYDGSEPYAGLIQGSDGNLYGTTIFGGNNANDLNSSSGGYGTVFKISLDGFLTTFFSFCNNQNSNGYCLDGAVPYGGVLQASDGNFYGTLYNGGTGIDNSGGVVYKLTPSAHFTVLHNFGSKRIWTDGAYPFDSLVQGTDGNLYGTTVNGGYGSDLGPGTVFRVTSSGTFTTLHRFHGTEGGFPYSALLQGKDGKLYGTNSTSIYKVSTTGAYNNVYTFCSLPNCADGSAPVGTLVETAHGTLFGLTAAGGVSNDGTVFKLTLNK